MRIVPSCCHRLLETSANFLEVLQNQILVVVCPFHFFSLVPPFIVSARYWSQTMSTLVDRFKSWQILGQNTLSKYESKFLPWTTVPGSECISAPPSITMKS